MRDLFHNQLLQSIALPIKPWQGLRSAFILVILGIGLYLPSAQAQNPNEASEPITATGAAEVERTCTRCHDETDKSGALRILQSKHAMRGDARTPFADQACATCHGDSKAHMQAPAEGQARALPDRVFGQDEDASDSTVQNAACLSCHKGGKRMHWRGSAHETQNLACTSCHQLHTGEDAVLSKLTQPDVCITCHKEKRAELHRPSTHPILDGQMACSDCHNPHGTTGNTLLAKNTVNETCYQCHSEKRGPFLWEHAPVREDCSNCHKPHGSVNAALLKQRPPWLCQQCHMAPQHPSTAYSGVSLPTTVTPSGAQQMLGKSCLNCHSQVHGSNHPSGVRKTR